MLFMGYCVISFGNLLSVSYRDLKNVIGVDGHGVKGGPT